MGSLTKAHAPDSLDRQLARAVASEIPCRARSEPCAQAHESSVLWARLRYRRKLAGVRADIGHVVGHDQMRNFGISR